MMMMLLSQFNGTSTPKGPYSAKTDVNYPMSLNRLCTEPPSSRRPVLVLTSNTIRPSTFYPIKGNTSPDLQHQVSHTTGIAWWTYSPLECPPWDCGTSLAAYPSRLLWPFGLSPTLPIITLDQNKGMNSGCDTTISCSDFQNKLTTGWSFDTWHVSGFCSAAPSQPNTSHIRIILMATIMTMVKGNIRLVRKQDWWLH